MEKIAVVTPSSIVSDHRPAILSYWIGSRLTGDSQANVNCLAGTSRIDHSACSKPEDSNVSAQVFSLRLRAAWSIRELSARIVASQSAPNSIGKDRRPAIRVHMLAGGAVVGDCNRESCTITAGLKSKREIKVI